MNTGVRECRARLQTGLNVDTPRFFKGSSDCAENPMPAVRLARTGALSLAFDDPQGQAGMSVSFQVLQRCNAGREEARAAVEQDQLSR